MRHPLLAKTSIGAILISGCMAGLLPGQDRARLEWQPLQENGTTTRFRIKIDNDSDVPMTAYLILVKPRVKVGILDFSYGFRDSLIDRKGEEVPAHGSALPQVSPSPTVAEDDQLILVACLFADGSTCGDPEWAGLLATRRANHYRILDKVIGDLTAGRNLPSAQLKQRLDDSQAALTAEARGMEEERRAALGRVRGTSLVPLFEETDPAIKAASVEATAASVYRSDLDARYRQAKGLFRIGGPNGTALSQDDAKRQFEYLLAELVAEQRNIAAAKPGLAQ